MTTPAPALPADASSTLGAFCEALRSAAGDNLASLVVYGSAARGRYDPKTSDLNVAIVLRNASGAAVLQIAGVLHDAERANRIEPMILSVDELPRLAASFPTKVLDIQRRHIVLHGDDPFTGIVVSRDDIQRRTEQELHNLALRLRRRLVSARDDQHALAIAADDAAAPLAVNLRALLYLRGKVSDEFQPTLAIFDGAAAEFGLDADILDVTTKIHKQAESSMTPEQFGRLTDTVARAAAIAASSR